MKDNKLIIGVCDDQEVWRDMLKRLIYHFCISENIEYLVKEYSRAEEVLEAEEFPDILFLDIEMDGMTGIELKDYLEVLWSSIFVTLLAKKYHYSIIM